MIRADELDDGLVLDGEVYGIDQIQTSHAPCACTSGRHETPGPWYERRVDAERDAHIAACHVVHRTTAYTRTESHR